MEFLLKEIATYINGEVTGDGEIKITGVSGIGEATEGEVTFVSNPKYISMIENTKASAIIVTRELAREDKNLIICENPYLAFAEVMRLFSSVHYTPRGVHKDAFIGENVEIGNDVSIYPFVYIGNNVQIGAKTIIYPGVFIDDGVIIGSETLLYSNVSIREKCKIGNRVIIHCNSVIGSDGFGFTQDGEVHQKIPQIGSVRIDDDVEIGASNTIDRATMGVTWIQKGVKTDNLVHIAHNVIVGENTLLIAQVGISGSTTIGKSTILAGQVGVVGHIRIGDNVRVGAKSGVSKNLNDNGVFTGIPAYNHNEWLKSSAVVRKLPALKHKIDDMEKRLRELEKKVP